MSSPAVIAVLGAGSWGTALAVALARNGQQVRLWGHLPDAVDRLAHDRENAEFLPGITFPPALQPTRDLAAALVAADEILVVVPSHAFAAVLADIANHVPRPRTLSWATKGFDPGSGRLLHEVAAERFPGTSLAVISGPTFAGEVARGLPTAVTVAATTESHASALAGYLHSESFRAYTSDDIIGVEVGGASKNVMAIAAGIADGLGYGANARAALITRGLAEITRLGTMLGAQPATLMGLAGLGDLALTCTDNQSRNRRLGLALASGLSVAEARAQIGQEVEGIATTRELHQMARQYQVDMPITRQTYAVLWQHRSPQAAVADLLHRTPKPEKA